MTIEEFKARVKFVTREWGIFYGFLKGTPMIRRGDDLSGSNADRIAVDVLRRNPKIRYDCDCDCCEGNRALADVVLQLCLGTTPGLVESLTNLSDDFKETNSKILFPRHVMVVPLDNPNSHSYIINTPALQLKNTTEIEIAITTGKCDAADTFMRYEDGCHGNHMCYKMANLRAATDDEIDAFIDKHWARITAQHV